VMIPLTVKVATISVQLKCSYKEVDVN